MITLETAQALMLKRQKYGRPMFTGGMQDLYGMFMDCLGNQLGQNNKLYLVRKTQTWPSL